MKIKLLIILLIMILMFTGCSQSHFIWVTILNKIEAYSTDAPSYWNDKFEVVMKTEDNQIITSFNNFEFYTLVNPGDVVNIKAKYIKRTQLGVKIYEVDSVQFLNRPEDSQN